MSVKWALIGAGRHPILRVAPAFQSVANGELIGVWSHTRANAESLARQEKIPRVYDTIPDVLADADVDAVFISTPNSLHAEHTIAAAQAGKHVLVEKPMAVSSTDARSMVRASVDNQVLLGVAFHLRHHPAHQQARQIISSGAVGDILYATGQFVLHSFAPSAIASSPWKSDPAMMGGGGALMGMGVHVIDILTHLIGDRVVEVSAMTDGQIEEKPLDSFTVALLRFARGATATMTCSNRFPFSRNDLVLYGSQGRIICTDTVNMPGLGNLEVMLPHLSTGTETQMYSYPAWDNFANELEAFSQAVEGNGEFHALGDEAVHSVEVSDAILTSRRTGKVVGIDAA